SSLSTYQHIGGVRTTGYAAVPPCLAALIEQLKPRNIGLNGQWASLTNGYGIGHKRADDSFGQACRIAFGHLEKFFSPSRYQSDSLTAMGHGRIERASHGADGLFRC